MPSTLEAVGQITKSFGPFVENKVIPGAQAAGRKLFDLAIRRHPDITTATLGIPQLDNNGDYMTTFERVGLFALAAVSGKFIANRLLDTKEDFAPKSRLNERAFILQMESSLMLLAETGRQMSHRWAETGAVAGVDARPPFVILGTLADELFEAWGRAHLDKTDSLMVHKVRLGAALATFGVGAFWAAEYFREGNTMMSGLVSIAVTSNMVEVFSNAPDFDRSMQLATKDRIIDRLKRSEDLRHLRATELANLKRNPHKNQTTLVRCADQLSRAELLNEYWQAVTEDVHAASSSVELVAMMRGKLENAIFEPVERELALKIGVDAWKARFWAGAISGFKSTLTKSASTH